jgi:hypothetical protein
MKREEYEGFGPIGVGEGIGSQEIGTGVGEGIGCEEIGTGAGREEEWI